MITKSQDSKLKLSTNFYISVQQTMNIVVHCYNCILKNMVDAGGGGGTPIHYLYGYVPPKGVVILKLLI